MFNSFSVLQDHNFVRPFNGAQAVRDNYGGTVLEQLINSAFDQLLGGWVQAR